MSEAAAADEVRLYGVHLSYFTGKVRAFLLNKRIPYTELMPTQEIYRDFILPKTGVAFIPVVELADGNVIQDSSDIIDRLDAMSPLNPALPPTPRQRLAAALFEILGDEWMVLPAMHYRWTYNRDFAAMGFGAASLPNATLAEQREAGDRLCARFQGSLPALGVSPETIPAIETQYEAFLDLFSEHLRAHPYLLGGRPTLGDYGMMGPLYAHLLRDPRSGEMMHMRAPRVVNWIERMNAPPARFGNLVGMDHVPHTACAILELLWRDYWPVMADTLDKTEAWIDANGDKEFPRVIGRHEFRIGDATGARVVFPYAQYMWQRAFDVYEHLDERDRAAVAPFLAEIGLTQAFERKLRRRVRRVANRLRPSLS